NVTLKVYEVSELVGFKDPAYFSLIFKKYMGMTPQEFQKHNK
ncbi:helix-turn-helix domain-containing protein, partial [Paenibacillus odorifer]